VAGLDLSADNNEACRDWAHSWARLIVVNNAIQLIAPCPETEVHDSDSGRSR
jgi:hypothetical protein